MKATLSKRRTKTTTVVILCMVVLLLVLNLFSFNIKSKPTTTSSYAYYWINYNESFEDDEEEESNVETAATAPTPATTTATTTTTRTARSNTPNQTSSSTTTTTDGGLLLSVPFYVYEDMLFNNNDNPILSDFTNFFLTNAELKRISIKYGLGFIENDDDDDEKTNNGTQLIKKKLSFQDYILVNSYYKHGGDAMFINSALKHPMRTNDPTKAKLFVIPALGIMSSLIKIRYGTTKLGRKSGYKYLKHIDSYLLNNSTYFLKSQGADHIVSMQYMSDGKIASKGGSQTLSKCNIIEFNQSPKDKTNLRKDYIDKRIAFKAMYVGSPCSMITTTSTINNNNNKKTHDFALVATMNNNRNKNFESRRNICKWILGEQGQGNNNSNSNSNNNNHKYSMPVCGEGIQCPTLGRARLGFHVRGDTNSANRLYDTILSGTVPIFTLRQQYYCQPEWYDWSQLSYFVNYLKSKNNQTFFYEKLDTILQNETDIKIKTQNIINNKDLFDWNTLHPFDLYMYHLQVKLYPTTKVNNTTTKFSALILP